MGTGHRRWWSLGVVAVLVMVAGPAVPAQEAEDNAPAEQEETTGNEPQPRALVTQNNDLRLDDTGGVSSSLLLRDPGTTDDWEIEGGQNGHFELLDPSGDRRLFIEWGGASEPDKDIELDADGSDADIFVNADDQIRLTAGNDVVLIPGVGDGVGIGTTTPEERLEVTGNDGLTRLLVNEESVNARQRFLLELRNNGAPRFKFVNAATGREWQFSQSNIGDFLISFVGSGGPELIIKRDGQVQMGPGPVSTFTLDPAGNLFLTGTLTQGSDAAAKTDMTPVDPAAVLETLAGLEISEWSYRHTPGVRHVGPTAQDFAAAFGLGATDTGIASVDADGVALAAIQALTDRVAELEARLAALEADD